MEFQLGLTFLLFMALVIVLLFDLIRPVYAFTAVGFGLIVSGVIEVRQFIASFANESILTIFLLIFIAQVVRDNFNIFGGLDRLFQNTTNPRWFIFKKSLSVSALSSVMNNTPIVAMLIPYSVHWSKKNDISVSKLLLPLSFAAITGGMISVIGTSTNLVLNGFLEANSLAVLSLHDYLIPGVLVSVGAAIYSATVGYSLLPNKKSDPTEVSEFQKDYLVECTLISGKVGTCTVGSLGLRQLKDVFLAEVIRKNKVISPVHPKTELEVGDRLFFAGNKDAAIQFVSENELLDWSKSLKFNISKQNAIIEAVIPFNSGLVNSTLRNYGFRLKFNSAVIGIHRNGEKVEGKLGSIVLKPGDLLIIIAGDDFNKLVKSQRDLYVINDVRKPNTNAPKNAMHRNVFLIGALVLIAANVCSFISFFTLLIGMLGMAFVTKLTNSRKLKQEFNLELLMILGSAITLGIAMNKVGAGEVIVDLLQVLSPDLNLYVLISLIVILTVILTNFITNVAAVSIMFPIVFALSPLINFPISNLFLIVAFSSSAAFITPIGYQTNIMVMGPGGYTSKDFLKFGIPMTFLYFGILFLYLKFS
ncbi:MAG: di/tricarboxylate transporter [Salibacteraceae bacterium]|jgi:di/tricarboxylate transporter